jgi:hypothetical protein
LRVYKTRRFQRNKPKKGTLAMQTTILRAGGTPTYEDSTEEEAARQQEERVLTWLKRRLDNKIKREDELRRSKWLVVDPGGRRKLDNGKWVNCPTTVLPVAFNGMPGEKIHGKLKRMAKHGRLPLWAQESLSFLWVVRNPLHDESGSETEKAA